MKRSRYSATMSRCFGSSNQSRERKRRRGWTRVSEAMRNDSLRQPGHGDSRTEQSTGERLLPALLRRQRDMRRGDVKRLQIVARERGLGDRGAGQADFVE